MLWTKNLLLISTSSPTKATFDWLQNIPAFAELFFFFNILSNATRTTKHAHMHCSFSSFFFLSFKRASERNKQNHKRRTKIRNTQPTYRNQHNPKFHSKPIRVGHVPAISSPPSPEKPISNSHWGIPNYISCLVSVFFLLFFPFLSFFFCALLVLCHRDRTLFETRPHILVVCR